MTNTITRADLKFILKVCNNGFDNEDEQERMAELEATILSKEELKLI